MMKSLRDMLVGSRNSVVVPPKEAARAIGKAVVMLSVVVVLVVLAVTGAKMLLNSAGHGSWWGLPLLLFVPCCGAMGLLAAVKIMTPLEWLWAYGWHGRAVAPLFTGLIVAMWRAVADGWHKENILFALYDAWIWSLLCAAVSLLFVWGIYGAVNCVRVRRERAIAQ
jgi:hypothetical protein